MEPIISDVSYIEPEWMNKSRGLVKRDMKSHPVGSFAPPIKMELVDLTTLPDRIREAEANKTRTSDLFKSEGYKYLDQSRSNYCWTHSTTHCVMGRRAAMKQPKVELSAYSVGVTIKKGRNDGGWSALSLQYTTERGIWPTSLWPQGDFRQRSDSDPGWQEAALYKPTDGWAELDDPVYDRDMTKHQVLTCLINRCPVAGDFDWWGHAIALFDPVDSFPNLDPKDLRRYGIRFLNSHYNFGDQGFAILTQGKSVPDNAVAISGVLAT